MKVLVAGVGNVLRSDDAFGVEVSRRLDAMALPESVQVIETGIGGMALVQQLQDGYDALVVADAVDLGRPPGTIMLIDPEVVDVDALSTSDRHEALQDSHLVTPGKVFMLARALGVLPANLLLVGCQPEDAESVGMDMSAPVAAAVDVAVTEILRHLTEIGALEGHAGAGAA